MAPSYGVQLQRRPLRMSGGGSGGHAPHPAGALERARGRGEEALGEVHVQVEGARDGPSELAEPEAVAVDGLVQTRGRLGRGSILMLTVAVAVEEPGEELERGVGGVDGEAMRIRERLQRVE